MKRKKVFLILMLVWMVVIFALSSRDGTESSADSCKVGLAVCHVFVPGFDDWSSVDQLELAQKIDHPIRKTAHATEYAILGFFIYEVLYLDNKKRAWIAWVIGTAYATTDEIHQLFVPGRTGKLSDVLIDSGGCIAGILLLGILAGAVVNRMCHHAEYSVNDGEQK